MHEFNSMTFWEKQNYKDGKTIIGCQGLEEVGMDRQSTGDLEDGETVRMML